MGKVNDVKALWREVKIAAREAPAIYFAPLKGAIAALRRYAEPAKPELSSFKENRKVFVHSRTLQQKKRAADRRRAAKTLG